MVRAVPHVPDDTTDIFLLSEFDDVDTPCFKAAVDNIISYRRSVKIPVAAQGTEDDENPSGKKRPVLTSKLKQLATKWTARRAALRHALQTCTYWIPGLHE